MVPCTANRYTYGALKAILHRRHKRQRREKMSKFSEIFHNKKYAPWIPPFIILIVAIITYIAALAVRNFEFTWLMLGQFFGCVVGCFAVPVLGLLCRRHFSPSLTWLLGLMCLFGLFLERDFDLYNTVAIYDKILHTCFGFIGAGMVYALLLRWKGDKIPPVGVMVILILATLGMGAVWEIFEYSSALFTHEDPQRWADVLAQSIAAGEVVGNPMKDTMEDLIVTVTGSGVFCIVYAICIRVNNGKFFKKFFSEDAVNDKVEKPDFLNGKETLDE